MKPLTRKLKKCRDPDRVDLVALQKARREQADQKLKLKVKPKDDGSVFGGLVNDEREAKRRKMAAAAAAGNDMFGPALG
jgi:cyclin H